MTTVDAFDAKAFVSRRMSDALVRVEGVEVRQYPEESIVVVRVAKDDFERAIGLANDVDRELASRGFAGFVTIKSSQSAGGPARAPGQAGGLRGQRVVQFVNVLTARSRSSEIQPSLSYVPDAQNNIATATTPRHHLIFGRRGAGKTALLVETKRLVEAQGHVSLWFNVQSCRHEPPDRVFLMVVQRMCEVIRAFYEALSPTPRAQVVVAELSEGIERLLAAATPDQTSVTRLIPRVQTALRGFLGLRHTALYIFLDDFHYLERAEQPRLLDMIHGCVRDCDAWLKVAAIQHLTRWFDPDRQLGLQTGHDAVHIDLDVTLQDPASSKAFLEQVLLGYARHAGIERLSRVLSNGALDRLLLASGAVPRDYLTLCGRATQVAQQRENAKQVGVQDVNKAAGDAKQKKLDELEDDAASAREQSQRILAALQVVRSFCIDIRNWTYFRVDFRDKERCGQNYKLLESLMDLRLIHLVEASLSDEHHAGHRAEVYMLDLSQYAGQRFKRKLHVLDFHGGHFVLKSTGTNRPAVVGNTANRRLSLLRRAPLFELSKLSGQGGS